MADSQRDVIAFDLESTGVDISNSYIIQIAIQRLKWNNGQLEQVSEWKTYVKPPIPISEEITKLTHITNEHVADAPTFGTIAQKLVNGMRGCDIMSYNAMMLDLPLLAEECNRAGIEFLKLNEFRLIDPYNIFVAHEQRTLTAALKFYCDEEFGEDAAHDALNDVKAMIKVFNAQVPRYSIDMQDLNEFHKTYNQRNDMQYADYSRKLHWKDGVLYYANWGKFKNLPVEEDWSYVDWILFANFPADTKKVLEEYRQQYFENHPKEDTPFP